MKGLKRILATFLVGLMACSTVACDVSGKNPNDAPNDTGDTVKGYSYLAIDINPSLELLVNGETVVSVKACNEDAAVLLSGENLENMTVEEATEKVVELAEELGYLNEENDDVKITVSADEEEFIEKLIEKAEQGAKLGSELAKVNHSDRSADIRKVKKLQEENAELFNKLTPSKLRLIEAIMKYDETMTYELGASMKVSELAEMLDGLATEFKDIVGSEIEELFNAKYEEMKRLAKNQIAVIYGEDYKALWDRYIALEKLVKEIKMKAENVTISEQDKQTIKDLLGLNKPQTGAPEGGYGHHDHQFDPSVDWKLEEFDDYFDRYHRDEHGESTENVEEQLEDILDAYDKDEYVLTDEDLAAIQEVWGESIEAITFEDLEEFLDAIEEQLEALREAADLTIIEMGQIEIMESSLEEYKKTVLNAIEDDIRNYQQKLQKMKEDKMKN